LINDDDGVTICSASTVEKGAGVGKGGNIDAAKAVGRLIAERAKGKGVTQAVFDRGGYIYHGRVKALAEAAREAGLQF
jgi:large subunit ribosomal protein L18